MRTVIIVLLTASTLIAALAQPQLPRHDKHEDVMSLKEKVDLYETKIQRLEHQTYMTTADRFEQLREVNDYRNSLRPEVQEICGSLADELGTLEHAAHVHRNEFLTSNQLKESVGAGPHRKTHERANQAHAQRLHHIEQKREVTFHANKLCDDIETKFDDCNLRWTALQDEASDRHARASDM